MFDLFATILRVLFSEFQSRHQLLLENLSLRHPLAVLQRSTPRARLKSADQGKIIELPLVCGLHHRYARQAAA